MPIVQQKNEVSSRSETESAVDEDPSEMMIISTLSLPSNATSIRADITDAFSCENKTYGYYADVDNDCQIFHVCLPVTYANGKENTFRWSFICPEETIFSQDSFTCMRPDDMTITCEESYQYYELNRNFGMIDSNADKETSNEAAVAAESNENVSEAENENEPVKSVAQEQEAPITSQAKPVYAPKPSRRKPVIAPYATQRKPVNSYPLRKMPQTPVQPEAPDSATNHYSQDTNENMKPMEEEEPKPVVNKFSRRPVSSFIKDKMPESAISQVSSAASANAHHVQEQEIKHKFSRRPINVMDQSTKDKTQNSNSKTENTMPSRSDLLNQLRKRPSLFHKRPAEQPDEEKPEEQAKVAIAQEQQHFSALAADMPDFNTETHTADTEIEVSESNQVFVRPQETNENPHPQNAESLSNMAEEPVQALEEIPTVISEVVETPNAEEPETHNEPTFTKSNDKSDQEQEPQIIEEESETNANIQQTPEAQEEHFVEETQTITKMPNAEEVQNIEETQNIDDSQIAEGAPEMSPGLRASAEDLQSFDGTKANEEPLSSQEAEETQNVPEHQAAEETHSVEDHQNAEETPTVQEHQTADEMQNAEEQSGAEGSHTGEEPQYVPEHQAAEEMQNIKDQQAVEENETPEESPISEEETKADEESSPNAEEVSAALEVLAADQVPAAEKVPEAEEILNVDKTEAEEGILKEANAEEVSAPSLEDKLEENLKLNPIEEPTQSAEEMQAVQQSLAPIEESLMVAETEPVIHQEEGEESLVHKESEHSQTSEENLDSNNISASLDSNNADETAILEQHAEENDHVAAAQTIEQMESEKPAGAPESVPATDEMNQPQALVQQMYEDMNVNKHSVKGFKPVDPVMAQEAEQLIVDFINTLRKNDFTNETPGTQMAHHVAEATSEHEADGAMTELQDEENTKDSQENVAEIVKDELLEDINEIPAEAAAEKHEEMTKVLDSKQEAAAAEDTTAFKVLESQSIENMDESPKRQESALAAMNLPQEMYQIPVKVIISPVDEIAPDADQLAESEENSHKEAPPAAAVHMAGNKPLSIDDIVELVKERLDQKPKNEMETPMQLEHVLGAAPEDTVDEEQLPLAATEDEQPPSSQSVEEAIMPIYQRIGDPMQIDAADAPDAEQPSEALSPNLNAGEEQAQTLEDISEIKEKSNRSYKTKLDSRKRRFLFKADSS